MTILIGEEQWDNIILAYLVPPREDMPFQSPRVLIFTEKEPIRDGPSGLPSKIEPFDEVMRRELCNPDHLPGFLVQLTQTKQYVYCEGSVFKAINCKIDTVNDVDTGNSLLLPGQAANATYSNKTIYRIEIDWCMTEEDDPTVVDRVRKVAWTARTRGLIK
jgi:hypothetical protein